MSRSYGMQVEVGNPNARKLRAIREAMKKNWDFTDFDCEKGKDRRIEVIKAYGESSLCGGESELEFADRLAEAVWKANGGYCEITINATYLEYLPFSTYTMTRDKYKGIMAKHKKQ